MAGARLNGTDLTLDLDLTGGIEELRDDWIRLAAGADNIFATWEWASVWWRHFGSPGAERVLGCRRRDGELVALLPLYEATRRPIRVLRFVGGGAGDELGPIAAPGTPGLAAALRAAPGKLGASILLAERLPGGRGPAGGGSWATALEGVMLRREGSPVIDFEGLDWDGFLATRSSNFRSQVRRKERKLMRETDFSFRLCDDPDRLDGDLDSLFRLHRARWQGEDSGALEGRREAFHREFAPLALERGWLRLWLAEVDGEPVAAYYGFRFGEVDSYYQLGRDPSWDRYSVGLVLLSHTVRDAIENGRRQYRFLRGDESYKERFATADPGLETIALSDGPGGRMATLAARAALASPQPLRGVIAGRLG